MTDNTVQSVKTHAVGKPVLRLEDPPLLRGRGRFVDDLKFPQMLEAAFVRSPHAHAGIRRIDTAAARQWPGVHAVLTLADISPLLTQERLPLQFRTDQLRDDVAPMVLAKDEVVFVGEAVALVVAQSRAVAEDAAALVDVDYDVLPAISDCRAALSPGAPLAHRRKSSNQLIEFEQSYGDIAAAFARAAASSARQPQAAPRRRPLARRPRRARGLRRERGPADAVDLDATGPRGAGVPDAAVGPRRESDPRRRARCRRRLRRRNSSCIPKRS